MSTEGEQAAIRFADAVTSGDVEAGVALCHPEIEFNSVLGISGRAYLGHAGMRQYFDDVASAWREWTVEVEQVTEAADGRVAIVMTMHARGKGSGASLAERTAHIWNLTDGKLWRNQPYREPDEALRVLGLLPGERGPAPVWDEAARAPGRGSVIPIRRRRAQREGQALRALRELPEGPVDAIARALSRPLLPARRWLPLASFTFIVFEAPGAML